MAGVKVTDLPVLGAAASDDVLYIVDTSSNTSSQIEVSSLLPVLESGSFAPTLSSLTGAITSTGGPDGTYSKNGDVVTLTFSFNISLDFTISSTGALSFTLPIPIGTGFGYGLGVVDTAENINITILNNALTVKSDNLSLVLAVIPVCCTVQYIIL
jgi:hypothetical protein